MYEGGWKGGRKEGVGRMEFPNKDVYEGEWVNDLPDGEGMYVSEASGMEYRGRWRKGQFHGAGVLVGHLGSYDGDWDSNMKQVCVCVCV